MRSSRLRIVPGAIACSVALAACGSASLAGTSTGPDPGASLGFAHCMRAHGVPSFPDPRPGGGFQGGAIAGSHSPAFQAARKGCAHLLVAGAGRQAPTAAERATLLAYARCMRTHGVPSFPDPVTGSHVPPNTDVLVDGAMMFPVGSTIDPSAPAFRRADALCGGGGPGGQPKGG